MNVPIEYYSGTDSDGAWTEGNQTEDATVSSPGRKYTSVSKAPGRIGDNRCPFRSASRRASIAASISFVPFWCSSLSR